MSSRRLKKIWLATAIVLMVVSVAGFTAALVLNAFVLDTYNAYGEVPIPGSARLRLPAGDVTVSFHTGSSAVPPGAGCRCHSSG
jgi:hypothetical protein